MDKWQEVLMGVGVEVWVVTGFIYVVSIGIFGVLTGNTFVLRLVTMFGLPVYSGKIAKDFRVARSFNKKDVLGWLSIPGVCYAPVLADREGFYYTHTFKKKESNHGEVCISTRRSHHNIMSLGRESNHEFKDLTVLRGSVLVRTSSIRFSQFSSLKQYTNTDLRKRSPIVTLLDSGKVRNFEFLFAVDIGIEEKKRLMFTDRSSFIQSMRDIAYVDVGKPADQDVLILTGGTDIDTSYVFLKEAGVSK